MLLRRAAAAARRPANAAAAAAAARTRAARRPPCSPQCRSLSTALSSSAAADPIFALSSAPGVAAIAVFRLSGQGVKAAAQRLLRHPQGSGASLPRPRVASVRHVVHPVTGQLLDEALALWFPGPGSYTGEDMLELHVHGSRAVCSLVHDALAAAGGGLRQAHAGEFSLRAFENGKIDLTQAEGLSDLLAAETSVQHQQAVAQALGSEGATLRSLYDGWREDLSRHLARLEAAIDFVEEEINSAEILADTIPAVEALRSTIAKHARQGLRGERGRLGVRVTLAGAPNAGKSALLNALVGHDAAIVNEAAGTTRDVVEVAAALALPLPPEDPLEYEKRSGYGHDHDRGCEANNRSTATTTSSSSSSNNSGGSGALPVVLSDTAGVRVVAEAVEAEGVRRATTRWAESDLRLLVIDLAAVSPALLDALAVASATAAEAEVPRAEGDVVATSACSKPATDFAVAVDTQGVELVPVISELLKAAMNTNSLLQEGEIADGSSPCWNIGVVLNKSDLWAEDEDADNDGHGTGRTAVTVPEVLQNQELLSRALCLLFPELEQFRVSVASTSHSASAVGYDAGKSKSAVQQQLLPLWVVSCTTGEGLDDLSQAVASNARDMLGARRYVEGGGTCASDNPSSQLALASTYLPPLRAARCANSSPVAA
jgi:tRNA modification GTPase